MSAAVPTEAGFVTFVRGQGVTQAALPDGSPYVDWAYGAALELVNRAIRAASPLTYMLAVYNLGMSNLVNFAPDQAGQAFFQNLRQKFGVDSLNLGVVQSGSDQGTSTSYVVPDFVRNLSVADLAYLRDPWGRQYLAFAQRYGTVWGLT